MGKAEVLARALKNMTEKNTRSKIRTSLIRRQQIIFVAMIIVGVFLIATSQTVDQRLLNQGIAFIIVGFVGMLMSWTTFDVGGSLKEAVREVGRQDQEFLEKNQEFLEKNQKILEKNQKILEKNQEILERIAESQNTIIKILQNKD